jgi:HSP20 family protein
MFGNGNKKVVVRNNDNRMTEPFGMWDDFDNIFNAFRRDMDRMFWGPSIGSPLVPRMRVIRRGYQMPMNLEDKENSLLLTIEMPGVKKEDTKLSIEDGLLTISVKGRDEKEESEEGKYLFRERSSFSCSRCVRLPENIDEENVSAKMVDGVLHIEIPKIEPEMKEVKEITIE